jgi:hypothetical protein
VYRLGGSFAILALHDWLVRIANVPLKAWVILTPILVVFVFQHLVIYSFVEWLFCLVLSIVLFARFFHL